MMILMVMTMLGSGLMALTVTNLRMSDRQRRYAVAFNIAESGAAHAGLWLKQQGLAGTLPDDTVVWAEQALGDGTYTVTIEPNSDNVDNHQKRFTITAVGAAFEETQTVRVALREQSFGRYAYFTDSEVSSISGNPIWFKAGEIIDGPAHSNNTTGYYKEGSAWVTAPTYFHINYNGSTAPIFLDEVTCSADSIIYNPGTPTTDTDWRKIFLDGATGFKLSTGRIELPDNNTVQRDAAWGDTSGFPGDDGVYVPNTGSTVKGGIYIRGDSELQFQVDGSGNQQILVKQGSETTTITQNRTAGVTQVVKPDGSGFNYDGFTNGVIYSTGHINSLKGTIADNEVSGGTINRRNAWTVATNATAGKDIRITGHLEYQTPPDKTKPYSDEANLKAGTLGIVSEDVTIDDAAPSDLKLHAVVLAGGKTTTNGTFSAEWWAGDGDTSYGETGDLRGTLNLIGGLIQKKRGPVGTFNSSNGQQLSGYSKNYKYDPRMANNPPPFFPTTGRFDQTSWQRAAE
jgi:hypothetical protein